MDISTHKILHGLAIVCVARGEPPHLTLALYIQDLVD